MLPCIAIMQPADKENTNQVDFGFCGTPRCSLRSLFPLTSTPNLTTEGQDSLHNHPPAHMPVCSTLSLQRLQHNSLTIIPRPQLPLIMPRLLLYLLIKDPPIFPENPTPMQLRHCEQCKQQRCRNHEP